MSCCEKSTQAVDAYFEEAPEFARPICKKLRSLIFEAAPSLREVLKWSSPCYEGRGLVCGIGAFKQHVRLYFFKGGQLPDPSGILSGGEGNASGRSLKFASVSEIPVKVLTQLMREAARVDASGARSAPRARRKELAMPDDFAAALKRAAKAKTFFESLPPSCRREYIEWIITAKREETRTRRLNEAITMLGAGRRQNEQYRR